MDHADGHGSSVAGVASDVDGVLPRLGDPVAVDMANVEHRTSRVRSRPAPSLRGATSTRANPIRRRDGRSQSLCSAPACANTTDSQRAPGRVVDRGRRSRRRRDAPRRCRPPPPQAEPERKVGDVTVAVELPLAVEQVVGDLGRHHGRSPGGGLDRSGPRTGAGRPVRRRRPARQRAPHPPSTPSTRSSGSPTPSTPRHHDGRAALHHDDHDVVVAGAAAINASSAADSRSEVRSPPGAMRSPPPPAPAGGAQLMTGGAVRGLAVAERRGGRSAEDRAPTSTSVPRCLDVLALVGLGVADDHHRHVGVLQRSQASASSWTTSSTWSRSPSRAVTTCDARTSPSWTRGGAETAPQHGHTANGPSATIGRTAAPSTGSLRSSTTERAATSRANAR